MEAEVDAASRYQRRGALQVQVLGQRQLRSGKVERPTSRTQRWIQFVAFSKTEPAYVAPPGGRLSVRLEFDTARRVKRQPSLHGSLDVLQGRTCGHSRHGTLCR